MWKQRYAQPQGQMRANRRFAMARAPAPTPCQLAEMQSQAEVESPTIYRKSYGDPFSTLGFEFSGEVGVRVMESGGLM